MPKNRPTQTVRSLQGRVAASKRWNSANRQVVEAEYATARIADFVQRTVDAAPPLTAEQRQRLAALFAPAIQSRGGADAA